MKKNSIRLVIIFFILTFLPAHQVFAQDGAWGEVVDGNGNILYDQMSDQGVVTQAANWMPSITLPGVGTVSVPAEYHSYVTESGNTILMPTASTLFFMAANANESGFSSAASTMGTSGLTTVNSDNGNVVGFASLGAFFGALAGNQDIGLPTTTTATNFFNQVVSGQTNIWGLAPGGIMNFLSSLSKPSVTDGNLYTYMLLYTPGQCSSTPAGCSASQLALLPPVVPTLPPPPTVVVTQPPPPQSPCPGSRVKQGAITASASKTAPPYPLVVGQDPDKRGVDVVFSASVAPTIYTYYVAVPIKVKRAVVGYRCVKRVIVYPECIASASASISLTQKSRDWILNELSIRYPEAYLHHPNFSFNGGGCAWSASQNHVQVADPGDWNMLLSGHTSGTPVSSPRSFSRKNLFTAWLKEVVIVK